MMHAKFQDHGTLGSGEDFYSCLIMWSWRPSWLCYQDQAPLPKEAPHEIRLWLAAVSEKMFANNGHIHVFRPRAATDNPTGKT